MAWLAFKKNPPLPPLKVEDSLRGTELQKRPSTDGVYEQTRLPTSQPNWYDRDQLIIEGQSRHRRDEVFLYFEPEANSINWPPKSAFSRV